MTRHLAGFMAGVWCVLAIPAIARADEPRGPSEAALERMEAQLQAQQARIGELEKQLTLANSQDVEKVRTDALREQIKSILGEREFREQLIGSITQAGYDDGFFIKSSDDKYSMKVNGVFQFRWTYYDQQRTNRWQLPGLQRDDRTGFDVQRMRIALNGKFGDNASYHLTIRADAPDGYNARIHYAWANYRFADEFQVKAGIFRLASTHAQMQSDSNFNMIDRPMTDAVFGLGVGTGVRFWGQLFGKRLDYYVDIVNSLGSPDNRTITTDPAELDNNPALVAKLVWHALGDKPGKEFKDDPDFDHHPSPALDIGMHYAFNADEYDSRTLRVPFPLVNGYRQGGFGLTSTNGTQMNQFGLNANFKLAGFSLIGEYMLRTIDPKRVYSTPYTPWWILTNDGSTTAQHGAYVQAGYFLPIECLKDKLELVARVGGVSALASEQEGSWEYSAGANYYFDKQRCKLSADVTKVYEAPISSSTSSLANVNDNALVFRVQFQVAF